MVTEVELTGVALTLVGCPVGTEEKYQRTTSRHLLTMCHSFENNLIYFNLWLHISPSCDVMTLITAENGPG